MDLFDRGIETNSMDFLIEIDSVSLQLDDQGLVVVNNPTYHKDPSSLNSLTWHHRRLQ